MIVSFFKGGPDTSYTDFGWKEHFSFQRYILFRSYPHQSERQVVGVSDPLHSSGQSYDEDVVVKDVPQGPKQAGSQNGSLRDFHRSP